jgi:hypothetical protein
MKLRYQDWALFLPPSIKLAHIVVAASWIL